MLNENKNQKKRCDFVGHLVFLGELFFLFLLLHCLCSWFCFLTFCLENNWLRMIFGVLCICISNFVKIYEFKSFIFKFENTLDDKFIVHISLGMQGLA